MRRGRSAVVAVVAAASLLSLAACGQSGDQVSSANSASTTSSATTSPTTSGTTASEQPPEATTPAGTSRCTATELKGEVVPGDPGAGQRYATLVVTNQGQKTCTLYGYGGLALVGAPTKLERVPEPGPKLVTLPPGKKAGKNLHWGAVAGQGEPTTGPCQPTASKVTVIPPDERESFEVAWSQGPVCQHGLIRGSAYYSR